MLLCSSGRCQFVSRSFPLLCKENVKHFSVYIIIIIIIIIHEFQRDTSSQKLQAAVCHITVSVAMAGDVHRHTIGGTVQSSMHA